MRPLRLQRSITIVGCLAAVGLGLWAWQHRVELFYVPLKWHEVKRLHARATAGNAE